jgi:hypothetical protein
MRSTPWCARSGVALRIVVFVLDHEVIDTILRHLKRRDTERDRGTPDCPHLEDAS